MNVWSHLELDFNPKDCNCPRSASLVFTCRHFLAASNSIAAKKKKRGTKIVHFHIWVHVYMPYKRIPHTCKHNANKVQTVFLSQ